MSSGYRWVLHDPAGEDMVGGNFPVEDFGSQDDAEAWLSLNWRSLEERGADSVSLLEGDDLVYRMSLEES